MKNNKYNKVYNGLLGLLQTRTANKDRETSNRKIMDYGEKKYNQALPGTTYYLGLHRPSIKVLYIGKIWLMNELQKTAVDCNRGLYIHSE